MLNNQNIEFKFTYLALTLLGRNLYSNAWAALSELVANGLDAKATEIYIYIDARDKKNSIIEVADNGCGMSNEDFENNYASVGRNRRNEQDDAETVMGRKGIGKLAALYLSRHYSVSSKTKEGNSRTYEMDFSRDKETSDSEKPQLEYIKNPKITNEKFQNFKHGTIVRMENVDLRGYAEQSFKSLEAKLSDFFSTDNLKNQKIFLKIINNKSDLDEKEYKEIKKKISFETMTQILCFDERTFDRLNKKYSGREVEVPYKKKDESPYIHKIVVKKEEIEESNFSPQTNTEIVKTGNLTGWVGIHSTIKSKDKQRKLYNPFKLRIYVRNKLAISDFLPVINNTQVFSNFIEGEIGYDILDDNDFPDIATTSRQGMDENDERIVHLAKNVGKTITKLIQSRGKIRNAMIENEKNCEIKAKNQFSDDIDRKIQKILDSIPEDELKKSNSANLNVLKGCFLSIFKGELIKNKYRIFFSHSTEDKKILDFFFNTLMESGVEKDEVFYTSRDDKNQINIKEKLDEICRKNITDNRTAVFLYSTENFKKSEYCMFEAGAAWATRDCVEDVLLVCDDYKKNSLDLLNKGEFVATISDKTNILDPKQYDQVVQILNYMIKYLNKGRTSSNQLSTFEKINGVRGKKPNKSIIENWKKWIDGDIEKKTGKIYFYLK